MLSNEVRIAEHAADMKADENGCAITLRTDVDA